MIINKIKCQNRKILNTIFWLTTENHKHKNKEQHHKTAREGQTMERIYPSGISQGIYHPISLPNTWQKKTSVRCSGISTLLRRWCAFFTGKLRYVANKRPHSVNHFPQRKWWQRIPRRASELWWSLSVDISASLDSLQENLSHSH